MKTLQATQTRQSSGKPCSVVCRRADVCDARFYDCLLTPVPALFEYACVCASLGMLRVRVIEATDLPRMSPFSKPDPIVKLQIGTCRHAHKKFTKRDTTSRRLNSGVKLVRIRRASERASLGGDRILHPLDLSRADFLFPH